MNKLTEEQRDWLLEHLNNSSNVICDIKGEFYRYVYWIKIKAILNDLTDNSSYEELK